MPVKNVTITSENENQRVDNFLVTYCKGVPKTRIYKAIRKGEVRVNQKRVKPEYRLVVADVVRVPPLRTAERADLPKTTPRSVLKQIEQGILLETKDYLVVNKPSGIPVHGGTGIKTGLIEGIRELRPKEKFLELVHRIDRDTSGCLLIAKKRSVLVKLHELLLRKKVNKRYLALLQGKWRGEIKKVKQPLEKNHLASGERVVVVSEEGKPSETHFRPLKKFADMTLVEATPITGRTHQIRVHAKYLGHPVAGDEKYGDKEFNQWVKKQGVKRLFLHSASFYCELDEQKVIGICAPLELGLQQALARFAQQQNNDKA